MLDWAATPVSFVPLKSEVLVRLLIADLVGEELTRASIGTLRNDIADLATGSTRSSRSWRRARHSPQQR